MNIACESCGTRYTISAKRSGGSLFKIRCEECGDIIVVEPEQNSNESAEPEYAARWYVVADGNQVGPVTAGEVEERFHDGEVTGSSFVWRDGFSDWKELRAVEEFSFLPADEQLAPEEKTVVSESPAPPERDKDEETVVMPPEDFHEQAVAEGADTLDDASKELEETMAESPGSNARAEDTTGEIGAKTVDEDQIEQFVHDDLDAEGLAGDVDATENQSDTDEKSSSSPGIKSSDDLIGQRSEDSVLFSLNNLDDFEEEEGEADSDGQRGSGLIDLEALSSAHTEMDSDQEASEDNFVADSVQLPKSNRSSDTNRWLLWLIAGVVVVMLGGMGVLGWIVIQRTNRPTQQVRVGTQAAGAEGNQETGVDEQAVTATRNEAEKVAVAVANHEALDRLATRRATDKSSPDQRKVAKNQQAAPAERRRKEAPTELTGRREQPGTADKGTANNTSDQPTKKAQRPSKTQPQPQQKEVARNREAGTPKNQGGTVTAAGQANQAADQKEAEETNAASEKADQQERAKSQESKKGSSEVDQILDQIGSKKKGESGEDKSGASGGVKKEPPQKELPSGLSRQMVSSTIQEYRGRVEACGRSSNRRDLSGVVFIGMKIEPSGRVSSTEIKTSKFRGTDVGKCVESVVQGIEFPRTQSSLDVSRYPFKIN